MKKKIPSRAARKYAPGDTVELPDEKKKKPYDVWNNTAPNFIAPSAEQVQQPVFPTAIATPAIPTLTPTPNAGRVFGGATNSATDYTRTRKYAGVDWIEEDFNKGRQLDEVQRRYQNIFNPYLEEQATKSGVPITDKYNGYLTMERQKEILDDYNQKNNTNLSLEEYNNTLGGLNEIFTKYDPSGYNLRGSIEMGQGNKGGVNLYGYRNYSARNKFGEAENPAQPAVNKIALPEQSGGEQLDPLAGLNTGPIPSRYKQRNGIDLSGLAGLFPAAFNPKVKEADKLRLPKLQLEHPVITQPDVDRPIAAMAGQAAGVLQRNRTTDIASRVALSGQLQSGLNTGIQQVYDNSAQFTEGKRAEAIPILNQENVADFENKKYMAVDDVNYQRQRTAQVLSALSARNNQNAQTAAVRQSENRMRRNRNLQYDYQLTGIDYDNRISEIDGRIQSGRYDRSQLDKLAAERKRLEQEKSNTMRSIIYSSSKGGQIVSRYAKGGKVDPVKMENMRQSGRKEMAVFHHNLQKQLSDYQHALKMNTEFLKQSQGLLKANLNLIGKTYDVKMPKHTIPSSYKS